MLLVNDSVVDLSGPRGTADMSHAWLKWLRFFTPGIVILLLWAGLGAVTGRWAIKIPENWQDAIPSLGILIPAGVYYLTPFREWSNAPFSLDVTENLRRRLLQIARFDDDPNVFTWKQVRGIFYSLVDGDKSLTVKASQAYFNGYIWTTLADIRVIAIALGLWAFVLAATGVSDAGWVGGAYFALAAFSVLGSLRVTKLHKRIGEEQIEIIEHGYLDVLRERLGGVRDRSNTGNSANQGGA